MFSADVLCGMVASGSLVVLLDDGELGDVRATLRELGVPYCNARDARRGLRAPLLLSTPSAARELDAGTLDAPLHQLHVVICNEPPDAVPCDFALRRPVDSAVLALLARPPDGAGLERRRRKRVPLGVPAKLRVAGDVQEVFLAQISIAGCGLVSAVAPRAGSRVELEVPPELTAPRALTLAGCVIGAREVEDAEDDAYDVAVAFDALDLIDRITLRSLMGARHRPSQRRFPRRVLGVRDGTSRVLEGRVLSVEGLTVEPQPDLERGERLTLALYTGVGAAPILLDAEVCGEAGPDGCFLAFGELEPARTEKLLCLLESLVPAEPEDRFLPARRRREWVARRARC